MTGITLPMTDTYKSRLYYQQEPSLSFARCWPKMWWAWSNHW
jgi:hypothetical protein